MDNNGKDRNGLYYLWQLWKREAPILKDLRHALHILKRLGEIFQVRRL